MWKSFPLYYLYPSKVKRLPILDSKIFILVKYYALHYFTVSISFLCCKINQSINQSRQTRTSRGYRECRLECCCTNCLPSSTTSTSLCRWHLYCDLYWLPVRGRVDYKVAILCYKAVKLQQPSYLTCLPSSYRQSRVLRSSTSHLLSTQSSSTNIAARRFSCCASTVWNSLPSFVRTADSFTSFRSQLKTCSQPVRASDTLTRSFAHYKFVTFLNQKKPSIRCKKFDNLSLTILPGLY